MYIDTIIDCPNGFASAMQELITKGLGEFVIVDDEGTPIGLKSINRFYSPVANFNTPTIIYIRVAEEIFNKLFKSYTNIKILATCHCTVDIYSTLTGEAKITYLTYMNPTYSNEFLEDEITPNPLYQKVIPLGRWL